MFEPNVEVYFLSLSLSGFLKNKVPEMKRSGSFFNSNTFNMSNSGELLLSFLPQLKDPVRTISRQL